MPENYEYPEDCACCMSTHNIDKLFKCPVCGSLYCDNCITHDNPDYPVICKDCNNELNKTL